mgnify:CR=1 FL=1|tara:strand:+ start:34957 stop:36801 length:1845 start_codon:yes stop_codon:yes gene_type:complete
MFNLKENKSKSLFLIFGGIVLLAGYFIREYQFFIPYRLIDSKEKESFIKKSQSENFFFKDITSQIGINFNYQPPKISPIAYFRVDSLVQGPGSASVDINNDGYMDIFVVSSRAEEPSHLYISNDGKSFTESAAQYGLDTISDKDFFGLVPVFFDSDNDGDLDLYVSGIGCAKFFINEGSHFQDFSKESKLYECDSSQAAIFFDYDGDKLLDLYVLRYWGKSDLIHKNDPYVYINNLHNADNGGINTLYKNMGDNTFKDVTQSVGGGDPHWSYDASFADLDDDGNYEIYISNDYGPDTIYRLEDGKLKDISDIFNVPDRRYGMNVSLLDLGEQKPGVYISNQYVGHGYALYGNFFWQMRQREDIADQAKEYNLYDCGMAWGAAHGDFNLDGLEDLYIANGYAAPRKHYIEKENERYAKFSYSFPSLNQKSNFYYEWFLTALPGRITQDIRNWTKLIFRGSRFNQQDCLFLNHKNEFFFNVSKELSDVKIWNGKSVITTDPNNDGILDLFVTTNNGPVHYFKNTLTNSKEQWIGFTLKSSKTNQQAIGARVLIKQNKKQYFRWNTGGRSGLLSTSDPRIHFGLESNDDVQVLVKWPDGKTENYGTFKTGKYYEINY